MLLFSGFLTSLGLNINNIMRIKNRIYFLKITDVPNLKGREVFFLVLKIGMRLIHRDLQ